MTQPSLEQSLEQSLKQSLEPCDLVMKGGITSGVVYPKLIARLSTQYCFKSIGGTSAGAIAAAACAAAEFGRQNENPQAFDTLAQLPAELGTDTGTPAASMLFQLFQPAPALQKHYAVLVGALNAPSPIRAVGGALRSMLRRFWLYTLFSVVIAVLLLTPAVIAATGWRGMAAAAVALGLFAAWVAAPVFLLGLRSKPVAASISLPVMFVLTWWFAVHFGNATLSAGVLLAFTTAATVLLVAMLAVLMAGGGFAMTFLAGLRDNFYGMCNGRTSPGRSSGPEGLTDWLTTYLDKLAGLPAGAPPLTFGDLWDGRRAALDARAQLDPEPREPMPPRDRAVNLQVMTTAVTQQMSYSIPFRDNSNSFYYDPDEWEQLFPAAVMQWLKRAAHAEPESERNPRVTTAQGKVLLKLPRGPHLPVVVAVRMSLSFPLLLSAVPMYGVDYTVEGKRTEGKRVWFSDGGISSNMPLHFFDAPLPSHPTFAVTLKDPHPDHPILEHATACDADNGRVFLPPNNRGGVLRYWPEPDDRSVTGLFRFMWSIVNTMQNWRDEIQAPYPGYRDRLVRISQKPDEGGLNLNMPGRNIDALSAAGECAAERLADRFHPASTSPEAGGWLNHKGLRLATLLCIVEDMVLTPCMADADWDTVLDDYYKHEGRNRAELARHLLADMRALATHIKASGTSLGDVAPRPRSDFRVSPRI